MCYRISDRIRAHRESPNMSRIKLARADGFIPNQTNQPLPLRTHRCKSCVDVIVGLGAAGQGEVTQSNRTGNQKILELLAVCHVFPVGWGLEEIPPAGPTDGWVGKGSTRLR